MNFLLPALFRFLILVLVVGVIRSPQPVWGWGLSGLLFLAAIVWQFVEDTERLTKK
jgi:hypothetical protein